MDNRVTRAEKVVRDLKRKILTGALATGERLPAERELAEHYRVSRITIRDAISRLAHLGFVQTLPQSGTFIADYKRMPPWICWSTSSPAAKRWIRAS